MQTKEVLIVGAGAAGMAAAITLARHGIETVVLERNERIGKKILVSGNGKCNIGNRHIAPQRFYSNNPDFIVQALKGFDTTHIESFFASLGLALVEGKEGKLFPMSLQASSVTEALEDEAERLGVSLHYNTPVDEVRNNGGSFLVRSGDRRWRARFVVLTAGSAAAPQLGGNTGGYEMAQALGHTIVEPTPSLVQLVSDERWVQGCAGVKIAGSATLYVNNKAQLTKEGDLLFTRYGISGLAILDLSREASLALKQGAACHLTLDLMPHYTKAQLGTLLKRHIDTTRNRKLSRWLHGFLNKKLVPIILQQSHCKAKAEKDLNTKELNRLVHAIKHLKLTICDTKGFKHAEVATGGINTHEIDAQTMCSKLIDGLYFAGEIVDVDGERGGFNFHWAWSSGIRAAEAIASRYDKKKG